jgi:predicted ATP-grasp superfamily ATP-dependent carboligase
VTSPLLLIGASVRAAAQSAHRAGFEPCAIDLFGDCDLRQIARVRVSAGYPGDIPAIAEELPEAPFVYTGAIENSPEVLTELSRHRTLWGNDPSVIDRVRDPYRLQAFLTESSFPTIPLRKDDDSPTDPAGWLVKPYRSAHGSGIRYASGRPVGDACYFQRLIPGVSVGAAFLANGKDCQLIGTHRQLVGLSKDASQPFRFCGAVAPAGLAPEMNRTIAEIGSALVQLSGLRGLFGCDFIVNSEGPFLLEVNPRYTASMELWELLFDRALIGDHVRACRDGVFPEPVTSLPESEILKLIMYAPQSTIVPERLEEAVRETPGARLADLPESGHSLDFGHPVCTLLVSAKSSAELDSTVNAAIQSVGRACGWTHRGIESMCCDVSERIGAEFS